VRDEAENARDRAVKVVAGLLIAGGVFLAALTAAGFGSGWWRLFELACHFRVQYFFGLAVIAPALALCKRHRFAAGAGAFAALNLIDLVPLYVPARPAAERTPQTLRVMALNVRTSNPHHDRVRAVIRAEDPDIVLLMETDDRWIAALDELRATYPHRITKPRRDNFGIALFSKLPFERAESVEFGDAGVPSVVAVLSAGGAAFTVIGTHPLPPSSSWGSERRNRQFAAVAEYVWTADTPVLLLGDLNVTRFSAHFGRLLRDSGLCDSSRGRGFQPTWPAHRPLFSIPIDHALHSDEIRVVDRRVGPAVGSDHYPLIVDVNPPFR